MPYIKKFDRETSIYEHAESEGELNYHFTLLAIAYVQTHGLRYKTLNDIVGALDGAKAEFQRRVVGPYEDTKIEENGDVYPPSLLNGGRNA